MRYKKTMISFPEPVLKAMERFTRIVTNGNRSAFVTEAVKEKMSRLKQSAQSAKLRHAYRTVSKSGLRLTKEWETLDDDLWRWLVNEKKTKK